MNYSLSKADIDCFVPFHVDRTRALDRFACSYTRCRLAPRARRRQPNKPFLPDLCSRQAGKIYMWLGVPDQPTTAGQVIFKAYEPCSWSGRLSTLTHPHLPSPTLVRILLPFSLCLTVPHPATERVREITLKKGEKNASGRVNNLGLGESFPGPRCYSASMAVKGYVVNCIPRKYCSYFSVASSLHWCFHRLF